MRAHIHPLRRVPVALFLLAMMPALGHAQSQIDWTNLSLEDLLNAEVTSVARRPQSLASAPAAVFVISSQDIRRSGATSLPELLRLVPGVQVARYNNSKWSISARGLGGYYSSKLLVLVDGRAVYTPHFSGVFWEHQEIPLEDVERVEVIRGPGGTMWGANAVNGVINIITKSAASTQGGLAVIGGGTENKGLASVRFGDTFGDGWAYRAYGKGGVRELDGGNSVEDSIQHARSGFRIDRDTAASAFTFQGDVFKSEMRTPVMLPQLAAPYTRRLDDRADAEGFNVVGKWTRFLSPTSKIALQTYFDHNVRTEYLLDFKTDTFDVDFQHHLGLGGRHDIVWGAEFRNNVADLGNSPTMRYEPTHTSRHLVSAFAQDEVKLAESLSVTAGAKVEHYEDVGAGFGPNLRAMWTPVANHRVWGAISGAVRTPSLADQMATFEYAVLPPSQASLGLPVQIDLVGNPDRLPLERVVAYEAGYRVIPVPTLSIDVTTFRNHYSYLTSYSRSPATVRVSDGIPHIYIQSRHQRGAAGETHGLETVANWTPASRWTVSGSSTILRMNFHLTDPTVEAGGSLAALMTSPEVQFTGRSSLQLGNVEVDATVHRVGRWATEAVDGYTRVDLHTGWAATRALTFDVGVQNMLSERHRETDLFTFWAPAEIRRSGYARLSWRF